MSRNCSVALRLWFVAGGRSRCQVLAQCQAGNQLLEGPAKLQQHTRGTGAVGTQSETPALADRQAALDGNMAYLRLYAMAKGFVDAVNLKAETSAEQRSGITGASPGHLRAGQPSTTPQRPRAPGPQGPSATSSLARAILSCAIKAGQDEGSAQSLGACM